MAGFISDDFLLQNGSAQKLYHDFAAPLPIIDYHNHLPPAMVRSDHRFQTITEAWLDGDHYKWRAMRACGVNEQRITGDASDEEKFNAWANTVPKTLRNPLYHWTHLELKRYFSIDDLLDSRTASDIYHATSAQLQQPEMAACGLLTRMNVETLCTTDDPLDELQNHIGFTHESFRMLPTFRPDKIYNFSNAETLNQYLIHLGELCNLEIRTFDDMMRCLEHRIDFFHQAGCRLSDHGLTHLQKVDTSDATSVIPRVLGGRVVNDALRSQFTMAVLIELGRLYHERGWVQQYHLGPVRNASTRLMDHLGPDTGFDSIGDDQQLPGLHQLLDGLDATNQLPKTIVYNLNPSDNEAVATMVGNFNDGSVAGKMQFGSGWWFNDQKEGMERQLNTLSNMGMLSQFVGMLTDSRSFLSFPRHEYFRRILCNLLGTDMEKGELPGDIALIGGMVQDICYHNAKRYFDFKDA